MKPLKMKRRVVDMDETNAPFELVKKFNRIFDQLNHILVDRSNDVEALKICLLSRNHLMLDGLHGTSKTRFASEAFRRITGGVVFKKQFMKGTQSDEIFGPIISERYKKDAIWEHNTTKMLPEAHFAFLDEIYRASDLLLPSMMGILNEREFINGGVPMQCPLITAIGTTNFISSEEELNAFRDRFLVTVKVAPLSTGASRLRMINTFLAKPLHASETITLDELVQLQKLVRGVSFTLDVLEMYEELVDKYKRSLGKSFYISDRRYCETLRLMQAFHVMQQESEEESEFSPENLVAASYGLCRLNEDKETDAFQSVFQTVVGNYVKEKEEIKSMTVLRKELDKIEQQMVLASQKNLMAIHKKVKLVLESLQSTPIDEMPKTVKGSELFEECRTKAEDLVNDLVSKLGVTV